MLDLQPTAGLIGARVDLDLEQLLADDDLQADLRAALHEHLVLVLPELAPTPSQHVALGRIFGELQPCETYNVSHPESDFITVFDSDGGYKADHWHADASWREEVPLGAVLVMRQNPSVGGDTVFANCHLTYDSLSRGMKQLLSTRRARHEIGPDSFFEHPVVTAHPVTGRPVLFVNRIFTRAITNLPEDESMAILPLLINKVSQPEFTYRHQWNDGDVLIWDNWATQHYALYDYTERRITDRVAIAGRRLEAAK